ncbi:acetyltransferase, partial [Vibrio cholerae]|nr:acetyltransferase [Vibrio cholerae]
VMRCQPLRRALCCILKSSIRLV